LAEAERQARKRLARREKVWWRRKPQVAANRRPGSLEALDAAGHQFFAELTPQTAPKRAA